MKYMSEDITFCTYRRCKNMECERNPKRIRHRDILHSFADFKETKNRRCGCPKFRKQGETMRVLSLFDGMACGALALRAARIEIDTYDAFEIDKYAIRTAMHNFPFIKQHGDVFTADFTQFKGVDLVFGGSPCTYWSIAQKNNRETEASGMGWELFQQYVRAIKEAQPEYFIYENNKSMSRDIRDSIDRAFGFQAVLINSALVSAQNRQRLYWVGKRNADGTYSKVDVEQPQDRGILLRDILDTGLDLTGNGKRYCLTASYDGACAWNTIERNQRSMVAEPVGIGYRGRSENGKWQKRYESNGEQKANALTTATTDSMVSEPVRVGCMPSPDGTVKNSQGMRVYDVEGKGVNLTAQGGGLGAKTGLYAIPVEFNDDIPIKAVSYADGKAYTVYEVKDGQITIKGKQYPIKLADGFYIIRKLTVCEAKRLQTVPDWYEFPVSDSQAYKMLGNGWTVDVIAHILTSIKQETKKRNG